MGQLIDIVRSTVAGDVLIVDTDRSVSGQDGVSFDSRDDAEAAGDFPGMLATRLFDAIDGVTHVFSASNVVVVGRDDGWDAATVATVEDEVRRFFVFYDESDEDGGAAQSPPSSS